jgi:hypothetical protein
LQLYLKGGLIYATAQNITEKKLRELNREVRGLAKLEVGEVDLVQQSLFGQTVQLHDTNPKSFVPDLKVAINFIARIFTNW